MWSVELQWIMTDKWRVYRLVSSTHNKRGVIKSQQFFEKCSLKAISVSIQKQSHPDVAAKMHASPECYWLWMVQLTFSESLCAQMYSEFCRKMIFQCFFVFFTLNHARFLEHVRESTKNIFQHWKIPVYIFHTVSFLKKKSPWNNVKAKSLENIITILQMLFGFN